MIMYQFFLYSFQVCDIDERGALSMDSFPHSVFTFPKSFTSQISTGRTTISPLT